MESNEGPADNPGASRMELLSGVILLEAAHSDYNCTSEEMAHVVETLRSMYGLPEEYMGELMAMAHSEREQAVDLHRFTRFVNEKMSRQEKMELLAGIWRVILADGVIDKYEEHFARKITDLLWLDHKDFIAAKKKARGLSKNG